MSYLKNYTESICSKFKYTIVAIIVWLRSLLQEKLLNGFPYKNVGDLLMIAL